MVAKLKSFDWMLLAALGGILLFGLTALYSIGLGRPGSGYLERQVAALFIGLVMMVVVSFFNYRVVKNLTIPATIATIVILAAVLFFGEKVRGTRGWFFIGSFGFQPVELAKPVLILALARYFSLWTRHVGSLRTFIISGVITALPVGLILLQPDFGSAVIVFAIWLSMVVARGIPKRLFLSLAMLCAVGLLGAWLFLFQDYQKERIQSFLFPRADTSGAGYNVRQALIAIGGGQLLGTGIGAGSGSQLRFLPEAQTDFIFAVIAEELGFIGVLSLLLLWMLLFYRLVSTLRKTADDFAAFIIFGTLVVFFMQFVINVGGNLGLIPITGLVLPFVSYGGSALVASLTLVGLIQSIRIHST